MSTQLFLASSLYGLATLAAALDAGLFPEADRRILITSNNAPIPEVTPDLTTMAGHAALRARFDDHVDWNRFIAPHHPSGWSPRPDDAPLWERQVRTAWALGSAPVHLVVESIQVSPAQALCRLFPGAPVTVYADGLMSYGPTRVKLDPQIGVRVDRLLHPDLAPGLRPLLLREFDVPAETVPDAALRTVLAELADAAPAELLAEPLPAGAEPVLLLGQYLSALDLVTEAEEDALHLAMVRGAHALGHRDLVFKPHPGAPDRHSAVLRAEAERIGARLLVLDAPVLAEVAYQRLRPALVVGCFSTGLLTAATLYGLPVARTGTTGLLDRVTPYQNSNRVPLTLVDALVPDLADRAAVTAGRPPDADRVARTVGDGLLPAVGYAMQARILPELRPEAERWLATRLDARTRHYFKRRRLTALGLPGGLPSRYGTLPARPGVRRAVRRVRRLRRLVLARLR
ncbi:polysialyltransferase family glycosyltransferase [Streptomyces sp. BI20]|uniref:polysialyltransferase family glycosyltransferase n=1 Tax=Streptomyces sp. BI20 TaxID=3403460 RepID=UPI003C76AF32